MLANRGSPSAHQQVCAHTLKGAGRNGSGVRLAIGWCTCSQRWRHSPGGVGVVHAPIIVAFHIQVLVPRVCDFELQGAAWSTLAQNLRLSLLLISVMSKDLLSDGIYHVVDLQQYSPCCSHHRI